MTGRLLTARETGERLGVHPETILVWIRKGDLPAFRLPGGGIRIRETDLENWLQARATPRGATSPATLNAARNGRLQSAPSPATKDEED